MEEILRYCEANGALIALEADEERHRHQDAGPLQSKSWHDIACALKSLESAAMPLAGEFMALNAWLFEPMVPNRAP